MRDDYEQLANELLLHNSGCHSVIGPADDVYFSDAALLWSSFYHLAFRTNISAMKRKWILTHLSSTATLFSVPMNYFSLGANGRVRAKRISPTTV